MGVVLAVNVEAVEGRNISNDCTLNLRSYVLLRSISFVYFSLCYVELSNCPLFVWNSTDPKRNILIVRIYYE